MISPLVIAGVLIASAGSVPYIYATMRGTVRPRLVSWAVWAVLSGIMTVSAYIAGEVPSALLSFCGFVCCVAVTILGWRQGRVKMGKLDIVCLIGAVLGIVSLGIFKSPLAAIAIAVAVDIVAFIPTLVHAWASPNEESLACFALASVGGICAVAAVLSGDITLTGLLYPVYSAVFNGVAALLIMTGRLGTLLDYRYSGEEV